MTPRRAWRPVITGRKMTPRQRRFVDEYLLDLNATQAAIRAGYSVRTANEQGRPACSQMLVSRRPSRRRNRLVATACRSPRTTCCTGYVAKRP
jgi:terminase small subunit-like protein